MNNTINVSNENLYKHLYIDNRPCNNESNDNDDIKYYILDMAGIIIYDLIQNNPLLYIREDYNEYIINYTVNIIEEQISHLFKDENETFYDIYLIVEDALKIYHSNISPNRSFNYTFIRIKPNIPYLQNKIKFLTELPQPSQKTDEWYEFRHNHLTASSIWKIFSTNCSKNQLIYSKCKSFEKNNFNNVSFDSTLHWGHKYEPLSVLIYEYKYDTKVSEFGCIPHNEHKFIAASPDGINTDEKSDLYGRMIEIKNVVSRNITGIPKKEYWVQMQIQMEVCDLNECDFLETKFVEYDTYEDFCNDGTFNTTHDGKHKGVIILLINENCVNDYIYEYCPLNYSEEQYLDFEKTIINKNSNYTWVKNVYWKLNVYSCILVLRNKLWFHHSISIMKEFWDIIQIEKTQGFEHRSPKKRIIHKKNIIHKCLLDPCNFADTLSNISDDNTLDILDNYVR